MKKPPALCTRCGREWEPSDEDSERCRECFAPRIEPEYPTDDNEDE